MESYMPASGGRCICKNPRSTDRRAADVFLNYANQYTKPFNEISGVATEFQNALASAARVFELIDEEPTVTDAEGAAAPGQVEGNVSMEHVNFSYNPEVRLIEDLNLTVKPGEDCNRRPDRLWKEYGH